LLNNRQQSGRRRGRGGQRQQGNGGRGPEQGNRIDNRARGNAPQLLEKYKTLARDAQMAGDRVMTEYYLQFADHYFRVVAESRARFEEQRRQRGDWQDEDEGYDGEDRAEADDQDGEDGDGEQDDPRRNSRDYARDQGREQGRDQNRGRDQQRAPREFRPREDNRNRDEPRARDDDRPRTEDRPRRPREGRFEREDRNGNARAENDDAPATIDVAVLPPSFGSDGPITPIADLPMGLEGEADEAPAAPKRRGRPKKVVEADAG
jgi:Domain of unknown function (DUF4167)